jgi:energy-coupling factor transporter ATP-binding protein EcfA2
MTTSPWDVFPADYRAAEVRAIAAALQAGECVSVAGLSGSGKSNLLGFLAHRQPAPGVRCVLVDCNRLPEPTPTALFALVQRALLPPRSAGGAGGGPETGSLTALDLALEQQLAAGPLALLIDRFDALLASAPPVLFNNLRALRDAYKFRLTYVIATRRPLPSDNELAELLHAHTLWVGVLAESDARWNVARYAQRKGLAWNDATADALIAFSRGYPALLRAACEAHAAGGALEALAAHPAVQARVAEFLADRPSADELARIGLAGHPLFAPTPAIDTTQLTAKEHALLSYFLAHPNEVCEKDDLIRAVWPEDRIFERGVRDDSLAQLIRRLREKIGAQFVMTVPGRGYRFKF